jgi:CHASE1-domain containing sensor protein
MQVQVIVALVAAGSALLVSLVTGISQILQLRANRRLELAMRLEQRINDESTKRFQETQEGLREACKALQRVQDEILLLTKVTPEAHISKAQKKGLMEARDHLLNIYREYHPLFADEDRKNLNEARKKVVDMILGLQLDRNWAKESSSLDYGLAKKLESTSIVLGHYHQQLLFSAVNATQFKLIGNKELD